MAAPKRIPAQRKSASIPTDTAQTVLRVSPPNLQSGHFQIQGISPYVQNCFSAKQQLVMEQTQREGQQARGKRVRKPKNFEELYRDAMHVGPGGWHGIPASAFRNAIIDACRLVGVKMTHAKLSVFTIHDGLDVNDGTPLVKISGTPRPFKAAVRNDNGSADLRWRPMWEEWSSIVHLQWDEDQLSLPDLTNLLNRAGLQVGIGEGRPNSPNSNGLGYGRFELTPDQKVATTKRKVSA